MMVLVVRWPLLALVPALILLLLGVRGGQSLARFAGFAWLAYAAYELGMKARILCSGECNIRIDLLVIHPVLLGLTLAGVVSWLWRMATHARR